jgi:hypothetical protein
LLQEFHVAYVFIRMANSPRPGVWALERSIDYGQTWDAWQFFADTPSDCYKFFESAADEPLYYDDQVLCTTEFSKVVPLEGGEVRDIVDVVSFCFKFLFCFYFFVLFSSSSSLLPARPIRSRQALLRLEIFVSLFVIRFLTN